MRAFAAEWILDQTAIKQGSVSSPELANERIQKESAEWQRDTIHFLKAGLQIEEGDCRDSGFTRNSGESVE
jgi:hypothetical protein